MLDLAVGMPGAPAEVPADLIAALLSRMSERQLVEIVSAVAWENYRARWNLALGMPAARTSTSDRGYHRGYAPVVGRFARRFADTASGLLLVIGILRDQERARPHLREEAHRQIT